MPDAFKRRAHDWMLRKKQWLPNGFSMTIVVVIDAIMVAILGIAALQRPASQWLVVLIALAIACVPEIIFFGFNLGDTSRYEGPALCVAWLSGTAVLLFATPTPITGDFAPLQLSLTVGVVGAITSIRAGVIAAVAATALLGTATVLHRLNTPALYLSFVAIGLLVGLLMRSQQSLLMKQRQLQDQLSEHAAADERRRIAREIHDVIAHSLSVVLLHLTGARHALQNQDIDAETVGALKRAEHLGRQAMADIRRTVGLLNSQTGGHTPEPGIADIDVLVDDFHRAGLNIDFQVSGRLDDVSAAAGLALYRIAQESLANVAKHAPTAACQMTLTASRSAATLRAVNELPDGPGTWSITSGRGLHGMKQRIELLGGTVDVGPGHDGWSVQATVPASANTTDCSTQMSAW
jgi:signal transduction histidine kinase